MDKKLVNVLFVCMGNICRSPAAEGILKHLVKQDPSLNVYVESCGIGNWHLGQAPDLRIQQASKRRGIALTNQAQQFQKHFLDKFDYILVSDHEVLKYLYHFAKTPEQKKKIFLMTEFSSIYKGEEIPDPFYQGEIAFELVLDMLEDACRGLLEEIRSRQSTTHF
jgi:protein-tyrosine phosphatase